MDETRPPAAVLASRRARAAVVAAAALVFVAGLGATDLWIPDEPRYAQVADEMRSMQNGAGGLVLLHLHGEPYTQKPPLYFWLAALFGAPAGRVGEWAARLPSALAGVATVAVTAWMGARLVGPAAATLGAALLVGNFDFAASARRASLDVLLTLFETLALAAFLRLDAGLGKPRANLVAMHGSLALAMLAKGPVGWLIPALVIAAWLAWERRPQRLRAAFPLWGVALAFAPTLLWLGGSTLLAPAGFFETAVVANLFERYASGTAHDRPLWYFAQKLPVNLLPWTLLLLPVGLLVPRALGAGAPPDQRRTWRFLLCWVGVTFVFFSFSSGKRPRYLLTSYPAWTLLMSHALWLWLGDARRAPRALAVALAALAALALGAAGWVASADPFRDAARSSAVAIALAALLALAAAAWIALARRGVPAFDRCAVPAAVSAAAMLLGTLVAFPALDRRNSPRPVAEAASALAGPSEPIGVLQEGALAEGIAYYGRRRVANLPTLESVADFAARGGRIVVLEEEDRAALEAAVPLEVRERVAHDDAWLLVVTLGAAPGGRAQSR